MTTRGRREREREKEYVLTTDFLQLQLKFFCLVSITVSNLGLGSVLGSGLGSGVVFSVRVRVGFRIRVSSLCFTN